MMSLVQFQPGLKVGHVDSVLFVYLECWRKEKGRSLFPSSHPAAVAPWAARQDLFTTDKLF